MTNKMLFAAVLALGTLGMLAPAGVADAGNLSVLPLYYDGDNLYDLDTSLLNPPGGGGCPRGRYQVIYVFKEEIARHDVLKYYLSSTDEFLKKDGHYRFWLELPVGRPWIIKLYTAAGCDKRGSAYER